MNKKIIRVIQKDESLMNLTWVVNNICNNRCSYCIPDLNSGMGHHYSWDNAQKFLEILFERYPKIHCAVSGGEPSMSEFFPDLVKTFNLAGHTIGVTSNAFKPLEFWQYISKYLYYICFSYHPEFPAKDFREKAISSSLNTFVTVRVMMFPSKWDHCMEVFNSLKDIDTILVEPVRVLDWSQKDRTSFVYTKEQSDWFETEEALIPHKKSLPHIIERGEPVELQSMFQFDDLSVAADQDVNPVQFINSGMTNFRGYVCEIGLKSLFVHYNGKITLGNCAVGGSIGEIENFENIVWPTKPVICKKDICHCATDVNINKWVRNYNRIYG